MAASSKASDSNHSNDVSRPASEPLPLASVRVCWVGDGVEREEGYHSKMGRQLAVERQSHRPFLQKKKKKNHI